MVSTLFLLGDVLKEGFVGIILTLDTLIYGLVSSSFKVFMAIAGARLLSSSAYTEIANKLYVIVGVLMLFVLSYAILRAIIDPDQSTKGEFGPKMIKNVIVAVVGLAIVPFLFNLMYQAQGLILEQDVLGKLFFRIDNTDKVATGGSMTTEDGTTVTFDPEVNPDEYVKSIGGAVTATSLWQAFFYPAEDSGKSAEEIVADPSSYFVAGGISALLCAGSVALAFVPGLHLLGIGAAVATCASAYMNISGGIQASQLSDGKITLQEAYSLAAAGESFGIFTVFLDNYVNDGEVTYLFGISTIAGAFALYAFISFSIDMGIRAAKLAYLQIVAPVPLVMQVLPKFKDNFNKYTKMVTSTFIEVFIRISIVYIVVYIICHLTELFSSVSMWSASSDLNFAEKTLALALLILGLIAFCKQAPKIIADSLNLGSGNMDLGFKGFNKKLADGGFYAAKSMTGGGFKAATRNVRRTIEDGGNKRQIFTSALGGFGSGFARATMMNFGPGHKPAETWRQSNDITENAAQAANDAHDKRWERTERNKSDMERAKKARAALEMAEAAYNGAKGTPQEAAMLQKLKEAQEAYTEAMSAAFKSSAVGAVADDLEKRARAWTTGTVSTAKEEAAMKFGDALDGLKGKLREEAYKKDSVSRRLHDQYTALKSQPINQYADGWDEQSYNAEYRRRLAELNSIAADPNLQSKLTDVNNARIRRDNAEAALKSLESAGVAKTDARYLAAKQTLDAERVSLENATSALNSLVSTSKGFDITVDANGQMQLDMSDIKVDMQTAMAKRDKEVESIRIAMEAAADAFVQAKAQEKDSNTARDIQNFISQNADYIHDNANVEIVVGYEKDANGNTDYSKPIKELLSAAIAKGFGKDAVDKGKFNPGSDFKAQAAFELETTHDGKITYKLEGDEYVPYDQNNNPVNSADYPRYSIEDFFEKAIQRGVEAGKIKKANSKTAVAQAADKGKSSSTYVRTNDYADKVTRQRKAQEDKGGKK